MWPSLVLAESPLFLGMFHNLLLHVESFPLPDSVHIFQRLVRRVCLFSEVQILLLCGGNPEWVTGDYLQKSTCQWSGGILAPQKTNPSLKTYIKKAGLPLSM